MSKRTEKKPPTGVTTLHQFLAKKSVHVTQPSKPIVGQECKSGTDKTASLQPLRESTNHSNSTTGKMPENMTRDQQASEFLTEENAPPGGDPPSSVKRPSTKAPSAPLCQSSGQKSDGASLATLVQDKAVPDGDYPLICFDLETTGLSIDDEIVQISACGVIDGVHEEFNQYVLPAKKMAFGASKVTGIRLKRGCMYHNKRKVQTCSILQALNNFIHWLKRFPKSLLVAHNAQFDSRLLVKSCVKYNLMPFGLKKAIAGFVDTVPVFKELLPKRANHQLEPLVKDLLGMRFKAHDAKEDTNALLQLIGHKSVNRELLLKHSYTVQQAEGSYLVLVQKKRNMKSLQELVDASALSKGMAEKAAGSGLTKDDLTSAVKSKGLEGLKEVFQADCNGKPRVTNRTAVVEILFEHLSLADS